MELKNTTPAAEIQNAVLWTCGRTLAEAGKILVEAKLIRSRMRDTSDLLEFAGMQFEVPGHLWHFAYRADGGAVTMNAPRIVAINREWAKTMGIREWKPVEQGASAPAAANEFTNLESKREAMRTGITNLLATLSLTRRDMAGMGDAEILDALAATYTGLGIADAGAELATLATTARELEQVTPESLAGFAAAQCARMDAERQTSPAAQELAATWTADTRTEDERLAQFYGSMAASDATADWSGLQHLRATSERGSHDSAVENATRAAHYARLHLAAA